MKIQHGPHHWVAVALVLAVLLLTLSEAHGQSTGAAAAFEGRPAMAGAQAGQGAMAGPPQGGIAVEGSSDMTVRRDDTTPRRDVQPRRDIQPTRDQSLAKDERSAVKKGKRAAKRVIKRSRTGVGDIDAQNKPGG
jgi:hypothetical protein